MLIVRDAQGRILCRLEGDDATPRDEAGKVIAQRAGKDSETKTLTRLAAHWMSGGPALLDLGPSDVLKPGTEAEYSIPDSTMGCVADRVSPVKFVKHDQGYWYTENVGDAIQLVITTVDTVGDPPELSPGYTATLFRTVGYALRVKLPRELLGNADFDLKKRATRRLCEALRLSREARVATLLTTSANYLAANRIAASAKWNSTTGAPLTDLFKALAASYLPADTLVMPEIAAQYFYGNNGGTTNPTQVKDYVQAYGPMPSVAMARSKQLYNGAPAYTWMPTGIGNVALVRTTTYDAYYEHHNGKSVPWNEPRPEWEPNDRETDIGTSATFRWLGDGGPDGLRVGGVLVREFLDKTSSGGTGDTWIVVAVNDIEVVVSNKVGAIITGAVA
jgi:hypothetical protein